MNHASSCAWGLFIERLRATVIGFRINLDVSCAIKLPTVTVISWIRERNKQLSIGPSLYAFRWPVLRDTCRRFCSANNLSKRHGHLQVVPGSAVGRCWGQSILNVAEQNVGTTRGPPVPRQDGCNNPLAIVGGHRGKIGCGVRDFTEQVERFPQRSGVCVATTANVIVAESFGVAKDFFACHDLSPVSVPPLNRRGRVPGSAGGRCWLGAIAARRRIFLQRSTRTNGMCRLLTIGSHHSSSCPQWLFQIAQPARGMHASFGLSRTGAACGSQSGQGPNQESFSCCPLVSSTRLTRAPNFPSPALLQPGRLRSRFVPSRDRRRRPWHGCVHKSNLRPAGTPRRGGIEPLTRTS